MKELLTDLQISKIEAFCNDKEMQEAVKTVLLAGIYTHGTVKEGKAFNPLINGAFSLVSLATQNPIPDAELGAHLRGVWAGINALENAFAALNNIKNGIKVDEDEENEAI